jgi:hypothetical protein
MNDRAEHVAGVEMRNVFRILIGNLEEKDHPKDLDADGRNVLKWILWNGGCRLDSSISG